MDRDHACPDSIGCSVPAVEISAQRIVEATLALFAMSTVLLHPFFSIQSTVVET